jgi:ribosomal-protein-alanine N-acetyltransferase
MSDSTGFPILQTRRIQLRRIVTSDLDSLFTGLSNPAVTNWYGLSYSSMEETRAQLTWFDHILEQRSGIWWAICRPENPADLLGTCGFYDYDKENRNTDMGYWLHPENWGKQIMSESLRMILHYGFSKLNLHRVEAEVEPQNLASSQLLRKLAFTLDGRRRQCEWREDHFIDLDYYSLLSKEFT